MFNIFNRQEGSKQDMFEEGFNAQLLKHALRKLEDEINSGRITNDKYQIDQLQGLDFNECTVVDTNGETTSLDMVRTLIHHASTIKQSKTLKNYIMNLPSDEIPTIEVFMRFFELVKEIDDSINQKY